MDLNKIIAELQAEKERLDEAILALERLIAAKGKARGRPHKATEEEPSAPDSGPSDSSATMDGASGELPAAAEAALRRS